jgi:ABC-type bacteriocin/lantibiotic exporter with double-glycine peptidase domain
MNKIFAQLKYLGGLVRFGFSARPILWLSVALSVFTSALEIFTITLLYPLSLMAQGQLLPSGHFLNRIFDGYFLATKHLLMAILTLLVIRFLLSLVNQGVIIRAGRSLYTIITSRIFKSVLNDLPISKLNSDGIGYYTSLAGEESTRASTTIMNLSQFFNLVCLTLLYFVTLAFFSFKSFLFISGFLVLSLLLMIRPFKQLQRLGARQTDLSRFANLYFIDVFNNVKSIRCYSGERLILNNYVGKISEYMGLLFRIEFYHVAVKLVPLILLVALTGLVVQVSLGPGKSLDLTFVITLFAYLSRLLPTLGASLNTATRVISDSKSGKDISSFLKPSEPTAIEGIPPLGAVRDIRFEQVRFGYSSDKPLILDGFSYHFSAGKSYAIIGPSGVGKSTVFDLMIKFYRPISGRILINGISTETVSDADLRGKMILMEQRVTIFNESIRANITLGQDFPMDQVRRAAKLARIDDLIESLPGKYDEIIQYMGANLSGGQRQRIAIARAILRDPDVIILDESMSALDVEAKESIFGDLKRVFESKILISISHDPWIVQNSDTVIDFGDPAVTRPAG